MTKKELVINALSKIKDYDNIKALEITLNFKTGNTMNGYQPMYKGKKYTKKEWVFRTVSSFIRKKPSMKDEPIIRNISFDIKNIKSLNVRVKKK